MKRKPNYRERRYRYRYHAEDRWTGMVIGGMVIAAVGAVIYLVDYFLR